MRVHHCPERSSTAMSKARECILALLLERVLSLTSASLGKESRLSAWNQRGHNFLLIIRHSER